MPPTESQPKPDEKQKAKPDEKTIECRIVAVNYGGDRRGATVKVTERELRRVGRNVLLPLDEERRQKALEDHPPSEERALASERARREAWAKMETERERQHREANVAMARHVLEQAGATSVPR